MPLLFAEGQIHRKLREKGDRVSSSIRPCARAHLGVVSGSIVTIPHVFVGEEVMLLLVAVAVAVAAASSAAVNKKKTKKPVWGNDLGVPGYLTLSLYRVKSRRGEGTYQLTCLPSLTWYRLPPGTFLFFSFLTRETSILTFVTTSHFCFYFVVSYLVPPPSPRCRSPGARTIQFLSVYSTGKCSLIAQRYASSCFMP